MDTNSAVKMTDNQDSRLEAISRKLYQVPLNLNAHEIASLVYRSINDQSNSEYSKLQYQLLLLEGKVRKGEYGEVSKQVREDLRHIHELFSDFGEFIVFESAITEELESGVMEALPEDPTYQDVRSLSFRIIEGLYSKKAHRITGKLASINLKARDKPEGYENMNPDLLANLNSLKKLMFNYVNTIRYAESLLSEDLFPYLKLSASVFKLREDLSLSDVVKDSKIIYADDDEHWKSRTLFVFEDIGYESIIAEDRFKALEEFLNSSYGLETGTTISAKGDNGTVTYT